ncbi:MAG: hypothetical protein HKM89_10810 [Gemmatimonadales bacterium]|nr:hypothetical protein [Gemmatimonadales bacterium]
MSTYRMSRDRFVTVVTGLIIMLFGALVVSASMAFNTAPRSITVLALILVIAVCGAITAVAYLYTPTGVALTDKAVRIERPIGPVEIEYVTIRTVRVSNEWFGTSLKRPPGGNSGFFGIWGSFRSRALGSYTMYGTKARGAVVIATADGTIVVTPDDGERFGEELGRRVQRMSEREAPEG